MQHQLEIQYFWPLTEQIELDLDYSNCHKPKIYTEWSPIIGSLYTIGDGNITTMISASNLVLDIDTTTVKTKCKPNIISRCIYRLIGLKWEIK